MKSQLIKISLLALIVLSLGFAVSYALDKLPEEYYAYIEGQVTDSSGEALGEVKISAYNENLGSYSALSDAQGNYALKVPSEWKAFPGTPYIIFINKEDFPAIDDSLRLIRQKTYKRNYTLKSGKNSPALKGVVCYKDTHLPIEGARVILKLKGSNKIISVCDSDQSGEFQLYLLSDKGHNIFNRKYEYILAADKEDYVSFENAITQEEDKIYKVYLDDVKAPLAPDIEGGTFITNKSTYNLSGTKEPQSSLYINKVKKTEINNKAAWVSEVNLDAGENVFNLYLTDAAGNKSPDKKVTVTRDVEVPILLQISPENHSVLDTAAVNINGIISDNSKIESLMVNNQPVVFSSEGVFSLSNINLNVGKNLFIIVIKDAAGNKANYGYELFSQLYVEGDYIESPKVNQPTIF